MAAVKADGQAVAGGFRQFDVSADAAVEDLCSRPGSFAFAASQEVVQVVANVRSQTRAGFVQAQHDAGDFEVSIQSP